MALRAAMRDFVDVGIYFVIGITIVAIVNTPPVDQQTIPLVITSMALRKYLGRPCRLDGTLFPSQLVALPMPSLRQLWMLSAMVPVSPFWSLVP